MTISAELEAEITRLAYNEEWPVGSIARELQIHRDVVTRVLSATSKIKSEKKDRQLLVDPFLPYILETLTKYPKIHASRVFSMVKKRGYTGISQGHFRRIIAKKRPRKKQEAFVRLATLAGEQAQVDWGEFGKIAVPGGERKLTAFIMTLSWSRAVFVKFYLESRMVEFQHGFMDAFLFFNGVPRIIIHDNLKSGVLERAGTLIRFNPEFIKFAGHYRFEPRAAGVRKGSQKGRVERSVGYVRTNFFAGRTWTTIADLNQQALEWCIEDAQDRLWRAGERQTVRDSFIAEKKVLLPIPAAPYASYNKNLARISKVPYARFDTCDYSVPMEYVGRTLFVVADTEKVRIFDEKQNCVAEHDRSYGKSQTMTNPKHTEEILADKKRAQTPAGLRRLIDSVPQCETFVEEIAKSGGNIGGCVISLLKMLDLHGKNSLTKAVAEIVTSGRISLKNVHFVLNKLEQESKNSEKIFVVSVPKHLENLSVTTHDLSTYDKIAEIK